MVEIVKCKCGKVFKSKENEDKSAWDKFDEHMYNIMERAGITKRHFMKSCVG